MCFANEAMLGDGLCALDLELSGPSPSVSVTMGMIARAAASVVNYCVTNTRAPIGGVSRVIGEH